MSKLGTIRQYQYSPAAGGILGSLLKLGGKAVKGIGKLFGSKTKQVLTESVLPAAKKALPYVAPAAAVAGAELLAGGGGGGGATGGWGGGSRRRGRGITARELRGYRKVARLLHQEGMVSRRAHRGRAH